jgi:hypothetical protein
MNADRDNQNKPRMNANEREKNRDHPQVRVGWSRLEAQRFLRAAKERKEVKISADYTDYADFGFGTSQAATQKGTES